MVAATPRTTARDRRRIARRTYRLRTIIIRTAHAAAGGEATGVKAGEGAVWEEEEAGELTACRKALPSRMLHRPSGLQQ